MVVVKQEPQDEDQANPPPRAPKVLSSFFSEFLLLPHFPWAVLGGGGPVFLQRELQVLFLPVLESLINISPPLSLAIGCWGGGGMEAIRRRRNHNFLASFPAPRKLAIKKEVKEEKPGTPRKEVSKG